MGKKDKKQAAALARAAGVMPIGFTSTMPGTMASTPEPLPSSMPGTPHPGAQASTGPVPLSSPVPPLASAPVTQGSPDPALGADAQRQLLELAAERGSLAARLDQSLRDNQALEQRLAELAATVDDLRGQHSSADTQVQALAAERDNLLAENERLQDEIVQLPVELEAVAKSRAFRIMKAAPILAIRKPLSTLLIVGAMGALANLWDFSNLARTIYLAVGGIVLLVSAIQFLARND